MAKCLQRSEDVQYAWYTGDLDKRRHGTVQWHAWEKRGSLVMWKPLAYP
jgi:hypothetical protein